MKCQECGEELTQEMINVNMCWNCGNIIDKTLLEDSDFDAIEKAKRDTEVSLLANPYEINKETLAAFGINDIIFSTSHQLEGYSIEKYLGIVSGDTVIGTGMLSSFESDIADLFGNVSNSYSEKMRKAKNNALIKMLINATEYKANAVIGVSFDCMSLSRDLIGVSVSGTAVSINKTST